MLISLRIFLSVLALCRVVGSSSNSTDVDLSKNSHLKRLNADISGEVSTWLDFKNILAFRNTNRMNRHNVGIKRSLEHILIIKRKKVMHELLNVFTTDVLNEWQRINFNLKMDLPTMVERLMNNEISNDFWDFLEYLINFQPRDVVFMCMSRLTLIYPILLEIRHGNIIQFTNNQTLKIYEIRQFIESLIFTNTKLFVLKFSIKVMHWLNKFIAFLEGKVILSNDVLNQDSLSFFKDVRTVGYAINIPHFYENFESILSVLMELKKSKTLQKLKQYVKPPNLSSNTAPIIIGSFYILFLLMFPVIIIPICFLLLIIVLFMFILLTVSFSKMVWDEIFI